MTAIPSSSPGSHSPRQFEDLKLAAEAFRTAMIQSGAINHVGQDQYFEELRTLERALNPLNYRTDAQPKRISGASDIVDEAACLIWDELCPGIVMGDADRQHYENAAKAVLAIVPASQGAGNGEAVHLLDGGIDGPYNEADPARAEQKLVYVKRWRTIVSLPEKYAEEIVTALRAAPQPTTAGYTPNVPRFMEVVRSRWNFEENEFDAIEKVLLDPKCAAALSLPSTQSGGGK